MHLAFSISVQFSPFRYRFLLRVCIVLKATFLYCVPLGSHVTNCKLQYAEISLSDCNALMFLTVDRSISLLYSLSFSNTFSENNRLLGNNAEIINLTTID